MKNCADTLRTQQEADKLKRRSKPGARPTQVASGAIMESEDEESPDDVSWMNALETHRVEIIRCLDLDRQFMLSYLRSHRVLDDEDCQIILSAGPSRQQKVAKFLDSLLSRGKDAYKYFVEALEFEHAHLYEVMTGSPPLKDSHYGKASSSPVVSWILDDKQLRDFDREFLVKELTKQAEQYQRLLYMHDKTTKENLMLQKQLDELSESVQAKETTLEELRIELSRKKDFENRRINGIDLKAVSASCQDLVRSNAEKSEAIIALQARLLARNEHMERANKLIDEMKRKNENLMQQVRDLTINYDLERTESKKKTDQLRKVTCEKESFFKLKFELAKMTEDRDETQRKLEDFKNVAAALTARHDWLEREVEEESSKRDKVSERYIKMQDYIRNLEDEVNKERSENDALVRKVKRLTDEINTYKEQREFFATERENAVRERDQAISEREEATKLCRDMQRSRDEAVQRQIKTAAVYEEKYEQVVKQLGEREVACPCRKSRSVDSNPPSCALALEEPSEQPKDKDAEVESVPILQGLPPYSWTDRRLSEVISSIRRRVEKDVTVPAQGTRPQSTCESVPWPFHRLVESRSPVASMLEDPFLRVSEAELAASSDEASDKVADTSFDTHLPETADQGGKKWKGRSSERESRAGRSKESDAVKRRSDGLLWLRTTPDEEHKTCAKPEISSPSNESHPNEVHAILRYLSKLKRKDALPVVSSETRNDVDEESTSGNQSRSEHSSSDSVDEEEPTSCDAGVVVSHDEKPHPPLRRVYVPRVPRFRATTGDVALNGYRPAGRDRANDLDRSSTDLLVKRDAFIQKRRASEPTIGSAPFALKSSIEVTHF